MLKRVEMDTHVTLFEELAQEVGPVILVNTFHVEHEHAAALLEAGPLMRPTARPGPDSSPPSSPGASPGARRSSTSPCGSRSRRSGPLSADLTFQERRSPAIRTRRWPRRICSRRSPCPAALPHERSIEGRRPRVALYTVDVRTGGWSSL